MPSGYPDWHKGVKADIIAQTLEKILVDIVATSVGNLPIDIKANSVGNLPVDLKANSVEKLPIDIVAQSVGNLGINIKAPLSAGGKVQISLAENEIGNLPIDIKANSIGNIPVDLKANSIGNIPVDLKANSIGNIPVDIAAASLGTLGIDIQAQTLEKLDIDIIAQSIERILQAPSYGGARIVEASGALDIGETLEIFSVTGKGIVYGGHVYISAIDDPNNGRIEVNIDGFGYKGYTFAEYNTRGLTAENRFFIYNTIYNVSNRVYGFAFTPDITFESSYAVRLSVSSSASAGLNYWCVFIYALRA